MWKITRFDNKSAFFSTIYNIYFLSCYRRLLPIVGGDYVLSAIGVLFYLNRKFFSPIKVGLCLSVYNNFIPQCVAAKFVIRAIFVCTRIFLRQIGQKQFFSSDFKLGIL